MIRQSKSRMSDTKCEPIVADEIVHGASSQGSQLPSFYPQPNLRYVSRSARHNPATIAAHLEHGRERPVAETAPDVFSLHLGSNSAQDG